jgi:hypothetical protein
VQLIALKQINALALYVPAFRFVLLVDLESGLYVSTTKYMNPMCERELIPDCRARAIGLDPSGTADGLFAVYSSTVYLGQGGRRMLQTSFAKYVVPLPRSQDRLSNSTTVVCWLWA